MAGFAWRIGENGQTMLIAPGGGRVLPAAVAALPFTLPSVDPADYTTVVSGQTFTTLQSLDTGDDDTLYTGCIFEDITGNGLDIRNVSGCTIYNCTFRRLTGTGVRFRSTGSTSNCAVIGCDFDDIDRDGISAAQRSQDTPAVDHTGLIIYDNDITNTGADGTPYHGIYVQVTGVTVYGNRVNGSIGGNAISIRSSGLVQANAIDISAALDNFASGIKYFSDHKTGTPSTLEIIGNTITGGSQLYSGVELKYGGSPPAGETDASWVVADFTIQDNAISGVTDTEVLIDSAISGLAHVTVTQSGNT